MVYDIDRIKQHNRIEDVVTGHGVQLHQSGSHLTGRCPFHPDENPSLVVYPETRSFYCFGCGATGDVIDFIRKADGLSFKEALERLNDGSQPVRPDRNLPERLSLDDRMILTAACGVYHETLVRSPRVLDYLEKRGVGLQVVRRCRVGYSDGRSFQSYLKRRRLGLRRATQMGLLWRDGGETMAGRIVIPELRGAECIWMVGRVLDERQPKYRGLSLPKPILGYERVRGRPRVFVTEGAFDYLTGVSWGLAICALLGTQVRAERLTFLQRSRRVLIVFDNDEPGRESGADLARRLGARAHIVGLPEGVKDLNDLGRRPDGRAAFFRLVKEAERGAPQSQAEDEDPVETKL
jgi:DNA primase